MWGLVRKIVVDLGLGLVMGFWDRWQASRRAKRAEQERQRLIAQEAHKEGELRAKAAEREIQEAADAADDSPSDPLVW